MRDTPSSRSARHGPRGYRIHAGARALVGLLILPSILRGAEEAPPLHWETNWRTAFEHARSERRLVFVDYWAPWCPPCMEMEQRTFPDPRVAELLQNFVLLKLNVDTRGQIPRAPGISSPGMALPMYRFFDPGEVERLHILGFRAPDVFARQLSLVAANASTIVSLAASLKERESAQAHFELGQVYLETHAATFARDELDAAAKLARRNGDAALEQTAQIQAALTWLLDGTPAKGVKSLERIAKSPANPDCAVRAWMAIGQLRAADKDSMGAIDAYRRALSACPETSPLRHEVEVALADLEKH